MGKNYPKVKFVIAPFKKIFPLIHYFLNPRKGDFDWSNAVYWGYPKLKRKLINIKDKKEREKIEYQFFRVFYNKNLNLLNKKKIFFQKEWDKINEEVMNILSEICEIDWLKKDYQMKARISLNPICPRWIKSRTFDIYYKDNLRRMKGTAIHELLHFIYFEKWKKVFPKTEDKEFDSPHLVWQLSEMVPGIILNDFRVRRVFNYKFKSYKEYEKIKINGKFLYSYLKDFYKQRKDFEDFLRRSWRFVKKHERKINPF